MASNRLASGAVHGEMPVRVVRQLCAVRTDLRGRSFADKDQQFRTHGTILQSPVASSRQIFLQWKKLSSLTVGRVCSRAQQSLARFREGPITGATADNSPKENNEMTMQKTPITSEGLGGQLQETPKKEQGSEFNFKHPLVLTTLLSFSYVVVATSFVPPRLLGPLRILYTLQETVLTSTTVTRFVACLALFLHVMEAIYAAHLALQVDRENARRWTVSTLFYGYNTLRHLIAKSNARKSD